MSKVISRQAVRVTLSPRIVLDAAVLTRPAGGGRLLVAATAAVLFLAAGAAKLSTSSVAGLDGLPRALGAIEVAFGCWLLSGIARRVALPACSALLAAFAAYHAWQVFRGNAGPCGCFGSANLSHELLAVLCLVGSVACLLTTPQRVMAGRARLLSVATQGGFCALALWTLAAAGVEATAVPPQQSWGQDAIASLPQSHRSILGSGPWRVIFVDPACDRCQSVLSETESAYLSGLASEQLLLVLTGSNPDAGERLLSTLGAEVVALPGYMPPCLPAVLVLGDGIIQQATCGEAAVLPPRIASPELALQGP